MGINNKHIAALGSLGENIKDDDKAIHSLAIPNKNTKFKMHISSIIHL